MRQGLALHLRTRLRISSNQLVWRHVMREECNPRRSLLVMLGVFCLVVMLLVIFLRRTSDQDVRDSVPSADKQKSQSAGAISDWTKPRAAMARLTNALPAVVSDSGSARENDAEPNKNLDAPPSLDLPLSQGTIVSTIAVVDLDRIISSPRRQKILKQRAKKLHRRSNRQSRPELPCTVTCSYLTVRPGHLTVLP
jgi:hypothetical protein